MWSVGVYVSESRTIRERGNNKFLAFETTNWVERRKNEDVFHRAGGIHKAGVEKKKSSYVWTRNFVLLTEA